MLKRTSGIFKVKWITGSYASSLNIEWYAFSYTGSEDYIGEELVWVIPFNSDPGKTYSSFSKGICKDTLIIIDGPYPASKFKKYAKEYTIRYGGQEIFEDINILLNSTG